MNHYDDEENIIKLLQSIPLREIHLVNPTRDAKKFFFSLYHERRFENWVNNSGKDVPPPDFFSKKYEYMLDLVSIDELAVMDGAKCIVQLRGVRPFLSKKYDLTAHPRYHLTEDYSKKNLFDIEKYLKRKDNLILKADDEYEVIDAT